MNEKILALAEKWNVNGNFCATVDGKELFSVAHGYTDIENGTKYTAASITYVASVTKQFTAACVMMLAEKGLINIDDTLDKYMPEYRFADKVTLRQLLNMVSGIPNQLSVIGERLRKRRAEFDMPDSEFEKTVSRAMAPEKCTPTDFLEIVNAEPMIFTPGERFDYSDTNYMMLGEIVGRVSGLGFAGFMDAHIFRPLGMETACIGADNSEGPSYAVYDGVRHNMGKAHFITGEGSICANARELCIWLNAVLDKKLISPESWAECFRPVNGYGFGWHVMDGWYAHGGGDLGYSSMVWINPANRVAIAGAMNMAGGRFYDEMLAEVKKELNI